MTKLTTHRVKTVAKGGKTEPLQQRIRATLEAEHGSIKQAAWLFLLERVGSWSEDYEQDLLAMAQGYLDFARLQSDDITPLKSKTRKGSGGRPAGAHGPYLGPLCHRLFESENLFILTAALYIAGEEVDKARLGKAAANLYAKIRDRPARSRKAMLRRHRLPRRAQPLPSSARECMAAVSHAKQTQGRCPGESLEAALERALDIATKLALQYWHAPLVERISEFLTKHQRGSTATTRRKASGRPPARRSP